MSRIHKDSIYFYLLKDIVNIKDCFFRPYKVLKKTLIQEYTLNIK